MCVSLSIFSGRKRREGRKKGAGPVNVSVLVRHCNFSSRQKGPILFCVRTPPRRLHPLFFFVQTARKEKKAPTTGACFLGESSWREKGPLNGLGEKGRKGEEGSWNPLSELPPGDKTTTTAAAPAVCYCCFFGNPVQWNSSVV